jgi:glycosyltransferase involved in cell wall biosynthesis
LVVRRAVAWAGVAGSPTVTVSGFLLISPGPVDGYPPVQYQARLLAEAGYAVELITLPLHAARSGAAFSHPGVRVTCLPGWLLRSGRTALRIAALVAAVSVARWRLGRDRCVEICYDPIGVWISDLAPGRPARRVAHLHEVLQHDVLHIERRLPRAIDSFDLVVVPDTERAKLTRDKLNLKTLPVVVENYPLRAMVAPTAHERRGDSTFEVVYCGSLGLNQKLDTVIRSVPDWPKAAKLTLIGRDDTPVAARLRALARDLGLNDRVRFVGWMDLPEAEVRMAQADLGIAIFDDSTTQIRTALGASNKRYQFMKAGLPQIGDFNPGVPELIEGNGIGACVTAHDPGQIAGLVRAYAADDCRCRIEGARAFRLHEAKFNYERAFHRFLELTKAW